MFSFLSICRKYNWIFVTLQSFHLLLSCLFYYSLYTKFMIQQIWCSRLWRKSGFIEIRSWFLLQRWYIDVRFLYIYDGSAVLPNSHSSFDSSICHKTKIRTKSESPLFLWLNIPNKTILFLYISRRIYHCNLCECMKVS